MVETSPFSIPLTNLSPLNFPTYRRSTFRRERQPAAATHETTAVVVCHASVLLSTISKPHILQIPQDPCISPKMHLPTPTRLTPTLERLLRYRLEQGIFTLIFRFDSLLRFLLRRLPRSSTQPAPTLAPPLALPHPHRHPRPPRPLSRPCRVFHSCSSWNSFSSCFLSARYHRRRYCLAPFSWRCPRPRPCPPPLISSLPRLEVPLPPKPFRRRPAHLLHLVPLMMRTPPNGTLSCGALSPPAEAAVAVFACFLPPRRWLLPRRPLSDSNPQPQGRRASAMPQKRRGNCVRRSKSSGEQKKTGGARDGGKRVRVALRQLDLRGSKSVDGDEGS